MPNASIDARIEEALRLLRLLLAKTPPRSAAHRELVKVIEKLEVGTVKATH